MEGGFRFDKSFDLALDDTAFVLQLLVRGDELAELGLLVDLNGAKVLNLLVQLLSFLLTAFALSACHLSLHLLDLEVGIV